MRRREAALSALERIMLATFGRKWRLCVECGTPLGRRRKDALYCGKRCGWRARQRRRRERLRERPQIGVATRLLSEGVTSRLGSVFNLLHRRGGALPDPLLEPLGGRLQEPAQLPPHPGVVEETPRGLIGVGGALRRPVVAHEVPHEGPLPAWR
jgi:hypothetical protein